MEELTDLSNQLDWGDGILIRQVRTQTLPPSHCGGAPIYGGDRCQPELDPPYAETWSTDSQLRHGDCQVSVKLKDETTRLEARLTLSADGITGTASRASYEIVEDGAEGEGVWTCVGTDVGLTASLVK